MNFADFGLDASLLKALEEEGYKRPTPIQAMSIPEIMSGRDVMGSAQTGTGKTAAFLLPTIHRLLKSGHSQPVHPRPLRILVLAPTRELAIQIGQAAEVYARHTTLRWAVVVGGVSPHPQIRSLRSGVDLLVATPGRLADLQQQGYIDLRSVEYFILDEADRMLDMGFLPEVERLISRLPENRQTLFFSATLPRPIIALAERILSDPIRVRVSATKPDADSINQSVCFVDKSQKTRVLAAMLSTPAVKRAIVFTRTKHGADRVTRQLLQAGIRAEALHGNKSQQARQKTLERFRNHRPPVLVATDVVARGLDVDGVSHVLNYDLPNEPETYVHRIGRTGRAGAAGIAVSFCDSSEKPLLKAIERLLKRPLPVEAVQTTDAGTPSVATPEVPELEIPVQQYRPVHRTPAKSRTRNAGAARSTGTTRNAGPAAGEKPRRRTEAAKSGASGQQSSPRSSAKPAAATATQTARKPQRPAGNAQAQKGPAPRSGSKPAAKPNNNNARRRPR
jgi:ATP-dependent RNA helicase RhlE